MVEEDEITKQRLSILLAEYESVSDDIRVQVSFQTQTFGWMASAVGLFAGLVFSKLGVATGPEQLIALTAIAVLSSVFGMFLVDKDLLVLAHLQYLECGLKPALSSLGGAEVLGLQHFKHHWLYGSRRPTTRKAAMLLTGPFPHVLFVLVAVLCTLTVVATRIWFNPVALSSGGWLVCIGLACFCTVYLLVGVALVGRQWGSLGLCEQDDCELISAAASLTAEPENAG